MNLSCCLLLLSVLIVRTGWPANLALSTYLKDGFTPAAIASDTTGNVYLAGTAIIDPVAQTTSAVVAKVDQDLSRYVYLVYLDSAASDQVSAIAIDSSGNAYIAGSTTNPNFPVVGAGTLGTAPAGGTDMRSFVTKLNPQGEVVFSVLIGGSAMSTAQGIAVTPQGQILVSGIASSSEFPTTPGAYSVADSTNQWFLMELDAAADKLIFSATGIGGSSLALDTAGNIYMAGSSPGTNYPATPGAYQTKFVQGYFNLCSTACEISFPGGLQHITKVDPAASKLIYSTGLNDTTGSAGSTVNTGLAVDTAGNAYVTGTLLGALFPYTVTVAASTASYGSFLTKLDPAGANVLFSIPAGGAGVQVDSSGAVYVGGIVSSQNVHSQTMTTPVAPPAIFNWIPQPCWPDNVVAISGAYVLKVDPASGNVQDGQWIDGSAPGATGITLGNHRVWITGSTPAPDVPFTPGVFAPQNLGPGFLQGAYLSSVDFSSSLSGAPAIACVVDAGNLQHVGAVGKNQLLTIFGANLGPSTGVVAPDGMDTSVAGVSVTFDNLPAQLLYVSATQINLAVSASGTSPTLMQVNVNGASVRREFPVTASNPNVFADLSSNATSCPGGIEPGTGFAAVALNADGSFNSCLNPAKFGSTVSFFVDGASAPDQLLGIQAFVGFCSAATTASPASDFLDQVDVVLPATLLPCAESYNPNSAVNPFAVTFSNNGVPVGPRAIPALNGEPVLNFTPGQTLPMIVWVTQ